MPAKKPQVPAVESQQQKEKGKKVYYFHFVFVATQYYLQNILTIKPHRRRKDEADQWETGKA